MKHFLSAVFLLTSMWVFAQSNPVAVDDTVQGMEQTIIEIHPLLNDYDPDGDTIMIRYLYPISHGEVWYEDSTVYYKSDPLDGWSNWKSVGYKAAEVDNWSNMSEKAYMRIQLQANPNIPVAVSDSFHVINLVPTVLYPLENDYDPNGDAIKIAEITYTHQCDVELSSDSSHIILSPEYPAGEYVLFEYTVIESNTMDEYRSYEVESIVYLDQNVDMPVAVNDTFTITRLEYIDLDILANDYDLNGDDFYIEDVDYSSSKLDITLAQDCSYVNLGTNYNTPAEYYFKYSNKEIGTSTQYPSNEARVHLFIEENPDAPIAINDTIQMTGGIPGYLDVLQNDINPLGDTLEIYNYTFPAGTLSLSGNIFHIIIDTSFAGNTNFKYGIRYKDKPWLYSEDGWVNIKVSKNPDCPVGIVDWGSGISYSPITVDVLNNDYDPNGDPIEIMDVIKFSQFSTAIIEGDHIIYTSNAYTIGLDSIRYRIKQSDDPNYYSEWTNIYFNIEHNPIFTLLNPDTASTKSGIPVAINVLQNDIIPDTSGLSLRGHYPSPNLGIREYSSDTLIYTPYMSSSGIDSFAYSLWTDTVPLILATGMVYVNIENNYGYDSLTINNVNAGFHASGFQFSAGDEIFGEAIYNYGPHYEIPKGSGKHTFFTHNLWLGGLDENGSLHLAGERYKQAGNDFQPGPISNSYDLDFKNNWYSLWMLYKHEVTYHINSWWKEDYEPIRGISDWPGNGNTANGQAAQLAPYYDHDGNGFYDPMQGDYPLIRGDQCIYVIYNDDLEHTETQGERIGIEIHAMAYAFDEPDDSILNNTVFVHYDLINRSEHTYYDFYFGIFADIDLGYAWDDYVASYVQGSSFYVYNGKDIDGSGEPNSYGENPPSQSVTILAGPFIDPDQEDNPDGNCDYGVTGTNFGNGNIDDERFGLTRFTYFNNSAGPQGDPNIAPEYYKYLLGLWKDDTPVLFGGNGHSNNGAVASPCRFMYPEKSDPWNWGTDCEFPLGGYNQNELWWTEEQAGNNPFDRRGAGVSGPFTFQPGQIQEVEMAYIFANSYHSADSSRKLLLSYIDTLRSRVENGEIIIPNNELDINELPTNNNSFDIYPNPANNLIHIKYQEELSAAEYRIFNSMGTAMQTGKLTSEINISGLKPGLYIISIITDKGITSNKFIKQ